MECQMPCPVVEHSAEDLGGETLGTRMVKARGSLVRCTECFQCLLILRYLSLGLVLDTVDTQGETRVSRSRQP